MHTVYTNRPDHFFFYNVKMTADYCNFPMKVVVVDQETQDSKDFKAKKAHGKFPMMETPAGQMIFESSAIAAYIAREAGNQAFIGATAFEEAQVNQWVAFTSATIVPNFYKLALHVFGWVDNKAAHDDGLKNVKDAVKILNAQLQGRSWLVADKLTLADIVAFNALLVPYTFSLDAGFRKAMPEAAAWFLKMSKLPVVTRTAGYVKWVGAGAEQASAPAAGKAAKGGKKEKKAAAPKEDKKAAAPKEEKKAEAAAEEDDEFDPFAEDPEADAAAAASIKAKEADAKDKKKKAAPIAKSILLWEIKPWGEETNLDELAAMILGITMEGLVWKTEYKKEPVAYGIFKLIMGAVVEDDKVSTDIVQEAVEAFEDHVQSIDIISFNKL